MDLNILPFQVFSVASATLASYLTYIYCKRKHHCKLCKLSKSIKHEYDQLHPRRSPRLVNKVYSYKI